MKHSFFVLLFLSYSSIAAFSQSKVADQKLHITFIEKYQNDTVSVWIEDCKVIDKRVITSDQFGVTDLIFEALLPHEIKLGKEHIDIPCAFALKPSVKICIKINKIKNKYDIDLNKGSYLGIGKNNRKFFLTQSRRPLEFD